MLPVTHAVIDEDGDVLSTHALYSEAAHAAFVTRPLAAASAAGNRPGQDQIVALYDISCFDLLEALLWNSHLEVWEARARGSSVYHRSRLLREAVGLAVASVVKPAVAVEEDALW